MDSNSDSVKVSPVGTVIFARVCKELDGHVLREGQALTTQQDSTGKWYLIQAECPK